MLNGMCLRGQDRALFDSRLAYHLCSLREDAMDPDTTTLDRLALVRERAKWIREI